MATKVSVVVPTRDRPAFLAEALASVRALEEPDFAFEILVCDNGDDPATAEVAARFGATRLAVARPGAAAARNVGLSAATGQYIAFLDDDDVWLQGHLRPQIALLEAHPAPAAAIGQVCNAGWDLRTRGRAWPGGLPSHGRLFADFLTFYPQIGATVIRASAVERVGPFDEALLYDQDWDWHLRLARACQVGFVPVPCVLFRQRPPGYNDLLQWERTRFFRRVFLRNLRRAGPDRPPFPRVLRAYLAHSGSYARYFTESARAHALAGETGLALLCLGRATLASPPHAFKDLLRPTSVRAFAASVARTRRTRAGTTSA